MRVERPNTISLSTATMCDLLRVNQIVVDNIVSKQKSNRNKPAKFLVERSQTLYN